MTAWTRRPQPRMPSLQEYADAQAHPVSHELPGAHFEDAVPLASPTFACAVSHCPWREDRVVVMKEMRPILRGYPAAYHEVTDRAPNHVWSRMMWGWGAVQSVTHTVYLQDDLFLHPEFWRVIDLMVRAVPNRVIALISHHPYAPRAFADGHHWYRCGEVLGAGYIIPTMLMGAFLEHRDRLPPELQRENEDFQITRWLATTGRRAYNPIPAPIQTRPGIETTNPAISYPFRKSYVPWDAGPWSAGHAFLGKSWWTPASEPPDYGSCVAGDSRLPPTPFGPEVLKYA